MSNEVKVPIPRELMTLVMTNDAKDTGLTLDIADVILASKCEYFQYTEYM